MTFQINILSEFEYVNNFLKFYFSFAVLSSLQNAGLSTFSSYIIGIQVLNEKKESFYGPVTGMFNMDHYFVLFVLCVYKRERLSGCK